MKPFRICACFLMLACAEQTPIEADGPIPVGSPAGTNLPAKIVGAYALDNATLNGPKFELIVTSGPEASVVYLPNADITSLVRAIVFRGNGTVPYSSVCPEAVQVIEFRSSGKTYHACLGSNFNSMEMGSWNTTGADDALLAWNIWHDGQVIANEITPYEVSNDALVGYLVFPLPKSALSPMLVGDNQQYRKIKITLRKV